MLLLSLCSNVIALEATVRRAEDRVPAINCTQSRHSYYLVARGDLDDLLGVAPIKDTLA